MVTCLSCGQKLNDKARFCSACGQSVIGEADIQSQRMEVFEGVIHKCPNCGEVVDAFSIKCSSCGYEFRDIKSSSAVERFAEKLHRLGTRSKSKKISLIREFSVPNTREDLLEFLILALSNIDVTAYEGDSTYDKNLSNAWISKLDQVYCKAMLLFGKEPELKEIRKLYEDKLKRIHNGKVRRFWLVLAVIIGITVVMVFSFVCIVSEETKERIEKKDMELKSVVEDINYDFIRGDYDAALIKANTLYFDEGLSKSKSEDWDNQRESLINQIEQKKGKSK